MTTVLDIGCATHGSSESTNRLLQAFRPSYYLGADPLADGRIDEHDGRVVEVRSEAAWTYDGTVGFSRSGSSSSVTEGCDVPCFDLAALIAAMEPDELVLKLDAEGAEYVLLPHLLDAGVAGRVKLVLVEWHLEPRRGARRRIEAAWEGWMLEWTW